MFLFVDLTDSDLYRAIWVFIQESLEIVQSAIGFCITWPCSRVEEGANGNIKHGGVPVQLHSGEVLDGGEREGAYSVFLQ